MFQYFFSHRRSEQFWKQNTYHYFYQGKFHTADIFSTLPTYLPTSSCQRSKRTTPKLSNEGVNICVLASLLRLLKRDCGNHGLVELFAFFSYCQEITIYKFGLHIFWRSNIFASVVLWHDHKHLSFEKGWTRKKLKILLHKGFQPKKLRYVTSYKVLVL